MEVSEFTILADKTLQKIFDDIENANVNSVVDIDIMDDVIEIELPDGGQYVINKHNASQQIWLSSPVSGAGRFSYVDVDGSWIDAKGRSLFALLGEEFKDL